MSKDKHECKSIFLLLYTFMSHCHGIKIYMICIADAVVPITCVILVCLFALQHYGTHRVGYLFAPIVLGWLIVISTLGIYNIFHWNPNIYEALSPYYMYKFLRKTKKSGWMSLGGILLCVTGNSVLKRFLSKIESETLFIKLNKNPHNVRNIQVQKLCLQIWVIFHTQQYKLLSLLWYTQL